MGPAGSAWWRSRTCGASRPPAPPWPPRAWSSAPRRRPSSAPDAPRSSSSWPTTPVTASACAQNQNCELQKVAHYVGVDEEHFKRLRKRTRVVPVDDSNPAYVRDMNKCILCARCVRACHEITGIDAIDIAFRGNAATMSGFGDKPIMLSRCETCGECVSRCPTGALVFRNTRQATREVKTTCPYCAVGCQMYLGVRGSEIVGVRGRQGRPGQRRASLRQGAVRHRGLRPPRVPRQNTPHKEERGVRGSHLGRGARPGGEQVQDVPPEEIGVISSARATNEDNYVMQKFGRAVLGTNNLDHCARL